MRSASFFALLAAVGAVHAEGSTITKTSTLTQTSTTTHCNPTVTNCPLHSTGVSSVVVNPSGSDVPVTTSAAPSSVGTISSGLVTAQPSKTNSTVSATLSSSVPTGIATGAAAGGSMASTGALVAALAVAVAAAF